MHSSILRRIWFNFMAPCFGFFSSLHFQILRLGHHWKDIFIEMRIWCIKTGTVLVFTYFHAELLIITVRVDNSVWEFVKKKMVTRYAISKPQTVKRQFPADVVDRDFKIMFSCIQTAGWKGMEMLWQKIMMLTEYDVADRHTLHILLSNTLYN
jgi:hypothetical protein